MYDCGVRCREPELEENFNPPRDGLWAFTASAWFLGV